MFDQANRSFDDLILPPQTPASLLPSASLTTAKKPGFTPFRELNISPEKDRISFKISSIQESPLTYSPGQIGIEEVLWGDIKGFLGTWSLDEEVSNYKTVEQGTGNLESQIQS
jgi:hypothetical protein